MNLMLERGLKTKSFDMRNRRLFFLAHLGKGDHLCRNFD